MNKIKPILIEGGGIIISPRGGWIDSIQTHAPIQNEGRSRD